MKIILNDFQHVLQDAENEIASIREDIARVRERGRQIMEMSDPEGYQAMQATLGMLTDKIDNLQNMADDKAKQLQVNLLKYNISGADIINEEMIKDV